MLPADDVVVAALPQLERAVALDGSAARKRAYVAGVAGAAAAVARGRRGMGGDGGGWRGVGWRPHFFQ